jgi:hypothetical protein
MTIDTIDPATPDPNDVAGQGDDEIRAFKQVIVDTFPQAPTATPADPWDIVLQVGPRALNDVVNKATDADLAALDVRVGVTELAIVDHETRISTNEGDILALQNAPNPWPDGSLFVSASGASPTTLGIAGTWVARGDGRVLMGQASGFGGNAGTDQLSLAEAEIPPHKHQHTTFREGSGVFGLVPAVYRTSPATDTGNHFAGRDGSSDEWIAFNTDEGINTVGDAITLPEPPNFIVRFFERTA